MHIHGYYHANEWRKLKSHFLYILKTLKMGKGWKIEIFPKADFKLEDDKAGIFVRYDIPKKEMSIVVHYKRMSTLTFHNIQHEILHVFLNQFITIKKYDDEEALVEAINNILIKLQRRT